jgi:hypothetical protein
VALDPLSSKVFRYSGTLELQNTNHFYINIIAFIKLLNNSSYLLHSYDGANTAFTDGGTDTDGDDDTLSKSKGVKSFSLRRLLSFSLPVVH